jgi:transcriptional regulator with XRE-family HTH domain
MSTSLLRTVPNTLGRRIADCRERHGWTQKTLAEKAKLSITFVSEVENDRRVPGTEALLSLADALETSLDYLVKGAVDPAPARTSVEIPSELHELADEQGWSFSETTELLKYREMVFARRSRSAESDDPNRRLTKDEWRKLHTWAKRSPF